MRIKQIEYFLATAEYGGFNKAARSLNVSQPALSRQIKLLEEQVGFDLLVRSTSGTVGLSELGENFFYDVKPFYLEYVKLLKKYKATPEIDLRMLFEYSVCGPEFLIEGVQQAISNAGRESLQGLEYRFFEEKETSASNYGFSNKFLPDVWLSYGNNFDSNYTLVNTFQAPVFCVQSEKNEKQDELLLPANVPNELLRNVINGLKKSGLSRLQLRRDFQDWREARTAAFMGFGNTILPFRSESGMKHYGNLSALPETKKPICKVPCNLYMKNGERGSSSIEVEIKNLCEIVRRFSQAS